MRPYVDVPPLPLKQRALWELCLETWVTSKHSSRYNGVFKMQWFSPAARGFLAPCLFLQLHELSRRLQSGCSNSVFKRNVSMVNGKPTVNVTVDFTSTRK